MPTFNIIAYKHDDDDDNDDDYSDGDGDVCSRSNFNILECRLNDILLSCSTALIILNTFTFIFICFSC